jgi:hypothetical protein
MRKLSFIDISPSAEVLTLFRRALHSAAFALIGASGFLASALLPAHSYTVTPPHPSLKTSLTNLKQRYGCLIVAASGSFACIPPLLGWLSSNIHSTTAAGLAIALNISFGAPGQIVGVWIYKAEEKKKGYPTGHGTNAGLLFMVSIGCLGLLAYYRRLNKGIRMRGEGGKLYSY